MVVKMIDRRDLMNYLNFKSKYDRFPEIKVEGESWQGYKDIINRIQQHNANVIVIECYPGVNYNEIEENLIKPLNPSLVIKSDDYALEPHSLDKLLKPYLTDDRVFGYMSNFVIEDFYEKASIVKMNELISAQNGLTIVYGFGASLCKKYDLLLYLDMARYEIQMRYRSGALANWKCDNFKEDNLKKYKRGFFVEWRVADRLKERLFNKIDYYLDTNTPLEPKMISGRTLLNGARQTAEQPFRLVPYFDPGVWGGQWMKEVCGLDPNEENYAWSFDGVPEENSLYFRVNGIKVELPAQNVVLMEPLKLLGAKNIARFGSEFPIRFDFLDTMKGQNLSLQVHPLTDYIKSRFGMKYTQDESYYLLDANDDAVVYLGVKENINPTEFIKDLKRAQETNIFDDQKYINRYPVKKHDHILIPAGTIHCSGTNAMVLEISTSAYIFTFKLWDWNRLGLDGLPRPIHIDHGKEVIMYQRDDAWVRKNLINRIELISEEEGIKEEKTGLHEDEFIETRRHWFDRKVLHNTNGTVNVLNLVEGIEAIVESPTHKFPPLIVHFAETFIIPASVGEYTIRPYGKSIGTTCATIKAFIRNSLE